MNPEAASLGNVHRGRRDPAAAQQALDGALQIREAPFFAPCLFVFKGESRFVGSLGQQDRGLDLSPVAKRKTFPGFWLRKGSPTQVFKVLWCLGFAMSNLRVGVSWGYKNKGSGFHRLKAYCIGEPVIDLHRDFPRR